MHGMLGVVWCGCAQAEIAARRRAETMAANQLKLLEERTELARKTLKIDYSSLGISSLPKVPHHQRPRPTYATYSSYIHTLMPVSIFLSIDLSIFDLSVHPSVAWRCNETGLSIHPSIDMSLDGSITAAYIYPISAPLAIDASINLSPLIYLPPHLPIFVSCHTLVLFLHASIYVSIHVSICRQCMQQILNS
jgi:hypothetical protein